MNPFLLRFAHSQPDLEPQLTPMYYDPNIEAMVFALASGGNMQLKFVIDEPSIGVRTGTYETKTLTDSTRDETTDRSS